ncbi:MAG: malonyl-CoA decarboxylase [Rhodospirillales bacterium]|nr:malonyl-CoA decarboxylase [Rhodospirillales bacterium]
MAKLTLMNEAAAPVEAPTGLFDWARRRLASVWRDISASAPGEPEQSIAEQMQACLDGRGGEVSVRNRAARLANAYLQLDAAGQISFLATLAGFDSNPETIADAYRAFEEAADPALRTSATATLRRALEPPRIKLLRQFTTIPDGVKFLVDLRAALLKLTADSPALAAVEADLRGLLASWFDVGFLDLRRIDWSSPASLLERLVGYEAVHSIRSWRDLKNRLDSDRRCYAFFHPRMPAEPLIFVEVALVKGLASSVQGLLDEKAPLLDPHAADTAIFYSISNCQRGLSGISFGNFLIKRVVEELSAEFRNLRTFATLSPVPGFRSWIADTLAADPAGLFSADEEASLRTAAPADRPAAETGAAALAAILGRRGWFRDPAMLRAAEPVLRRLCARYLLHESKGRRALDPVAHFHLANGARLEQINMLADVSEKGVKEGATLMVNYLYDPERIEAWHEDYVGTGKRNASTAVRRLLRGWS